MIIKSFNMLNVSKLAFDVEHMHVITGFFMGEIERRKHCVQL